MNIAPITYRRYVDDSHARFHQPQQEDQFLEILNKQNKAIQYTIEKEDDKKSLNFLDLTIINTTSGNYDFKIFRKDAITNVQVKPEILPRNREHKSTTKVNITISLSYHGYQK